MSNSEAVLLARLGAMGDIIHTLPAAASLKQSFPDKRLIWIVKPKWMPLLSGNPFIDELVPFGWHNAQEVFASWRRIRRIKPVLAFDFQGLVQSAVLARASRPAELWGFDRSVARERASSVFYSKAIRVAGPHRVQRNLQLAHAAGARRLTDEAWLPAGREEGNLPTSPFVLTAPFAGWAGKQWPLERYEELATLLANEGITLVANVSEEQAEELSRFRNLCVHTSSIAGLIAAIRRATAVVGVDSGPLHIAAALKKPGVAIFGPTDPAATGPYGGSITVIRTPGTATTYNRHSTIHKSMMDISATEVFKLLMGSLEKKQNFVATRNV